jgi:hypothetical protein
MQSQRFCKVIRATDAAALADGKVPRQNSDTYAIWLCTREAIESFTLAWFGEKCDVRSYYVNMDRVHALGFDSVLVDAQCALIPPKSGQYLTADCLTERVYD